MKKLIMIALVATACGAWAAAQSAQVAKAPKTPEQKAAAHERMLTKSGGIIEKAGKGKIAFVNCQTKFSEAAVKERVDAIRRFLHVEMVILRGESITATNALSVAKRLPDGAAAALYIVDDAALPMSLGSLEEHWALCNVASIEGDRRFTRAVMRGAILAFGACVSQYKGSPMQTVSKPEDLDAIISDGFSLDNLVSVRRNLENLGVTQPQKASYKKACQDGWAPAPTNKYQQAIWDKVHEIPTNPIKIKFDPKKGQ